MVGEAGQDWLSEGDGVDPAKLVVRPRRRAAAPVNDPDVPFEPLPPGALDRWLTDAGMMPDAPPPDVTASVATAHDLLGRSLEQLARIAADPNTDTGDRIAAIREAGKIADTLSGRKAASAQRRSVEDIDVEIERELRAAGWTVERPGGRGA